MKRRLITFAAMGLLVVGIALGGIAFRGFVPTASAAIAPPPPSGCSWVKRFQKTQAVTIEPNRPVVNLTVLALVSYKGTIYCGQTYGETCAEPTDNSYSTNLQAVNWGYIDSSAVNSNSWTTFFTYINPIYGGQTHCVPGPVMRAVREITVGGQLMDAATTTSKTVVTGGYVCGANSGGYVCP